MCWDTCKQHHSNDHPRETWRASTTEGPPHPDSRSQNVWRTSLHHVALAEVKVTPRSEASESSAKWSHERQIKNLGQSHLQTSKSVSQPKGLMSKHISTPFLTSLGLNGRAWIQPPWSPKWRTHEILAEEVHEIRFCWSNPPSFHGQIPIWVGEIPNSLLETTIFCWSNPYFCCLNPYFCWSNPYFCWSNPFFCWLNMVKPPIFSWNHRTTDGKPRCATAAGAPASPVGAGVARALQNLWFNQNPTLAALAQPS